MIFDGRRVSLPGAAMAGMINLVLQRDAVQQPDFGRGLVGRDPVDGSTWLRLTLRARERQPAAAKQSLERLSGGVQI
jgi:hypothetical protein